MMAEDLTRIVPGPEVVDDNKVRRLWEDHAEIEEPEWARGSVGRVAFDLPAAKDLELTVLLPRDQIAGVPNQGLVRIESRDTGEKYRGVVTEGPFTEPDGLRGDASALVTTAVRGASLFLPPYHGRMVVQLLGLVVDDTMVPPRHRPRPNSPVFLMAPDEAASTLRVNEGDLVLGTLIGEPEVQVMIPSDRKSVLPRHTAVLGTTGGGKSNTITRLVGEARDVGTAVVLFDVEGEYLALDQAADEPGIVAALKRRELSARGLESERTYNFHRHPPGHPAAPNPIPFVVQFESLSGHAVVELLDFNEAQEERYWSAYNLGREVLEKLGIYPSTDQEREWLLNEYDEFERGIPGLTLTRLTDIAQAAKNVAGGSDVWRFRDPRLERDRDQVIDLVRQRVETKKGAGDVPSRGKVWSRLHRLDKFGAFENAETQADGIKPISFEELVQPGAVGVIDLTRMTSTVLRNVVIAQILTGVFNAQNRAFGRWEAGDKAERPPKTMIVLEEAHEFISAARIARMPRLFEAIETIAKRGRKRWLELVFVTQSPQHMPQQVLELVNNFVLHKMGRDAAAHVRRGLAALDDSLTAYLPTLGPGAAVVSMGSYARPVIVQVDPGGCKLLLAD
jgi:DNA helicase HerA-like ATPase